MISGILCCIDLVSGRRIISILRSLKYLIALVKYGCQNPDTTAPNAQRLSLWVGVVTGLTHRQSQERALSCKEDRTVFRLKILREIVQVMQMAYDEESFLGSGIMHHAIFFFAI